MQLTLKEQMKALSNHPDQRVIDLLVILETLQDDLYCVSEEVKEIGGNLENFYDDFMGFDLPLAMIISE